MSSTLEAIEDTPLLLTACAELILPCYIHHSMVGPPLPIDTRDKMKTTHIQKHGQKDAAFSGGNAHCTRHLKQEGKRGLKTRVREKLHSSAGPALGSQHTAHITSTETAIVGRWPFHQVQFIFYSSTLSHQSVITFSSTHQPGAQHLSWRHRPWRCRPGGRGHGASSPTRCRTTRRP